MSIYQDAMYGWRQLVLHTVTSGAAILSLALAIGACTAAFSLIDALLFRPLPVAEPERLFRVVRESAGPDGTRVGSDACDYPLFRALRAATPS